jgi:hypothetical protein
MGKPAVIGLGILAWVLLAILVALFVARMIRMRDHHRPDRTEQRAPAVDRRPTAPSRFTRTRVAGTQHGLTPSGGVGSVPQIRGAGDAGRSTSGTERCDP